MRPGRGAAGTGLGPGAAATDDTALIDLLSFGPQFAPNARVQAGTNASAVNMDKRANLLDELYGVFPSPAISTPYSGVGVSWASVFSTARPDLALPPIQAGVGSVELASTAAKLEPQSQPAAQEAVPKKPEIIDQYGWELPAIVPSATAGKRSWAQFLSGSTANAKNNSIRAVLNDIFKNELNIEYVPSRKIMGIIENPNSPFNEMATRIHQLGLQTYAQKFFLLRMYRLYLDTINKKPVDTGRLLMYTNRLMEDILLYAYLNTLKEDEKSFLRSLIPFPTSGNITNSNTAVRRPGLFMSTTTPINLSPSVFAEALNQFLVANPDKARAFLLEPGSAPTDSEQYMPIIAGTRGEVTVGQRLSQLEKAGNIYQQILESRAAAFGNTRGAASAGIGAPRMDKVFERLTGRDPLTRAATATAGVLTTASNSATRLLGTIGSTAGAAAQRLANSGRKRVENALSAAPGVLGNGLQKGREAIGVAGAAATQVVSNTGDKLKYLLTGPKINTGNVSPPPSNDEGAAAAPRVASTVFASEELNTMGPSAAAPVALAVTTSTGSNGQSLKRRRTNLGPGPTNGNNRNNGYDPNRNFGGGRRTVKRKSRNARKPRKSRKSRKSRKARKNITRRR